MDIYVESGEKNLGACVELKNTNWDAIPLAKVKRYASRQIGQIWDYIEALLARGQDVSPGVIFPRLPKSATKRVLIEGLFNERGISVVWRDVP